jgi:AraC family transcriptional regulator
MSRVGATIDVRGAAENWVAPVATFDAARAFGEEVWIDAVENTAILWTNDGFEIGCEFGPRRGEVSTPFASTMVMQPRGTPNRYWSAGPIRFGQLHVTESLLVRVADALESSLTGSDQLRDDLVFFHDPAFFQYLNEYAVRAMSPEAPTRVEMEARSILIIERLLVMHHLRRRSRESGGLTSRQLRAVTEYLMARLADDVALADLARVAGLSPQHFCRAFKRSTGMPPHAWLVQKRIGRAQNLMRARPTLCLAEVAAYVGYNSQSAFGAVFKRATGFTPRQWRQKIDP